MALVASGNGLELLHAKAVPRWAWVVMWTALAAALMFWPRLPGLEATFQVEFGRGYVTAMCVVTGLLPLVSSRGRMFVRLLQWWLPFLLSAVWFVFLGYEGVATGKWALAGLWSPILTADVTLLFFRERLFLSVFFLTAFAGLALGPTVSCFYYDRMDGANFASYGACAESSYQGFAITLWGIGSCCLFLLGRKFANDAWAYTSNPQP